MDEIEERIKRCIIASLEKAAENARTNSDCETFNCPGMTVNKNTITSQANIVIVD